MRTGRLVIARGVEAAPAAFPAAPDPHLVEHRLAALERLSRLVEQGALSPEEFAAEKALVLRLPADDPSPSDPPTPRGPSLLGRLLRWQFLPAGIAAGLALSWWVQPHETMRLADQLFRTLGA